MTDLTPAVQAVLTAAQDLAGTFGSQLDQFGREGERLLAAVRALPPSTPPLPPEPEVDAAKRPRRGDDLRDPSEPLGIRIAHRLTQRERANEKSSRSAWEDLAVDSALYHRGLAEAYGFARTIVAEECQRTVPVSSPDPGLLTELAEALSNVADAYRGLIAVVREHGTPITPEVFEQRIALVPVDALLARVEATVNPTTEERADVR